MRPNRVRVCWDEKRVASCLWIDIGWPLGAEALAALAFDAFVLDLQHSLIDRSLVVPMLQALSTGRGAPMVRVSRNDAAEIGFVLDAGAYGVICPQIETPEECERFVAACHYAPRGTRSWGPTRGQLYGGPDYFDAYERTILKIAIIETAKGVRNMEAIAATPGLDMLYVGPNDLTIDYGGRPTYVAEDPRVIDAMTRSIEVAQRHGLRAGTYAGSAEVARAAFAKGYDLVSVGYAAKTMVKACQQLLDAALPR